MRLVPINCIKDGNFLAKTVYDLEGRVLLSKGVQLSDRIIRKAEQSGIMSLYINDEYSDNEIEDIIKPELRQKAIKAVKESFQGLANYYGDCDSKSNSNAIKARNECIKNINEIVNDLIDEIMAKKNVLIDLVDIKSMDNYTYEHSVNVTVLSVIIGLELNLTRDRLFNLAVGAMLHDMGKVFIPKDILLKNGRLTEQEFNIIKEHPLRGFDYLKCDMGINATSRIIVLQHHERVDGTGYPDGIYGDKIHDFSKIVAISDVYDALTSDRPYRMSMPPNEAVEYIMGSADRYFDLKVVSAFLKRIVPYPIGTLVKLSNGQIGVIEEINQEYPLRPKIKVVDSKAHNKKVEIIDLMDVKNIVIKGVQYKMP